MKKKSKTAKVRSADTGSLHRFVVSSAQEAVTQIREKLGPEAEVISVNQLKGSGLDRFLSSPKLEVVAHVKPVDKSPERVAIDLSREPTMEHSESASSSAEPTASTAKKNWKSDPPTPAEASAKNDRSPHLKRGTLLERIRKQSNSVDLTCRQFLEKAGLSPLLLARMASDDTWEKISEAPLATGIMQAVSWLKSYRKKLPQVDLSNRVAFIGSAGSGKTTALCKLLARDVFISGKCPQVVRMEVDKPHMDVGLSMYCDVLGVPYYRSDLEVDFSSQALIYLDFPGYSLSDNREQERMLSELDRLAITSRVFVQNAAYEEGVLNRSLEIAQKLGATHQILTHVDELIHCGKLWSYLLDSERHLLFLSSGQNIAGDRIDDAMGHLLERTFPL